MNLDFVIEVQFIVENIICFVFAAVVKTEQAIYNIRKLPKKMFLQSLH